MQSIYINPAQYREYPAPDRRRIERHREPRPVDLTYIRSVEPQCTGTALHSPTLTGVRIFDSWRQNARFHQPTSLATGLVGKYPKPVPPEQIKRITHLHAAPVYRTFRRMEPERYRKGARSTRLPHPINPPRNLGARCRGRPNPLLGAKRVVLWQQRTFEA